MYNYLLDVCLNEEFFINFLISLFIKYVLDILIFFIIMLENKKKYVDESFYLN